MDSSSQFSFGDTVAILLQREPDLAHVFLHRGMACVGCSMARFERLSDALTTYGLEASAFLADVQAIRSRRSAHNDPNTFEQGDDR